MGRGFLAYSKRRLRRIGRWMADPAAEQSRLLLRLARAAATTRFGREHDLASVRSVEDFQARVPLRSFQDLEPYWQRLRAGERDVVWPGRIRRFAVTSGSTGTPKYVPVSAAGLSAYLRAGRDVLTHYLAATGDVGHFEGRFLYLGGSREPVADSSGAVVNDLSGIAAEETPWFYRPFTLPSAQVSRIGDWEAKLDALAEEAWSADVRAVSGIPSWLVALFERVLARSAAAGRRPRTIGDVWPNLNLVVHGGVQFEPYRPLFEALIGKPVSMLEVYVASEGFLAIQDRPGSRDLLLRMDAGLFHEFVPVEALGRTDPPRHWAGTVETGVDYALAVSSANGLWGAYIGDTVRFESLRPHRLRFTGRTEEFSSAFGEHLRAADVQAAIVAACAAANAEVAEFHVAPLYPSAASLARRHEWLIQFTRPPAEPSRFLRTLDETLRRRNVDYDEHRANGTSLAEPIVVPLPAGCFYAAMQRLGRSGGQHKVPQLRNDRLFAAALLEASRQTSHERVRTDPRGGRSGRSHRSSD